VLVIADRQLIDGLGEPALAGALIQSELGRQIGHCQK
jgi:hypothetical protein